jgi:hypothetical protein
MENENLSHVASVGLLTGVLKGLAVYGTYGYQVIKRVTPVPILSHIDAIHTLTLLLKSL